MIIKVSYFNVFISIIVEYIWLIDLYLIWYSITIVFAVINHYLFDNRLQTGGLIVSLKQSSIHSTAVRWRVTCEFQLNQL